MPTGVVTLIVFIVISYFLSVHLDFGLGAYTIARFIKTYLELFIILRYTIKVVPRESWFIPPFYEWVKDFRKIVKNSFYTVVG